jgi:hypothetical protein
MRRRVSLVVIGELIRYEAIGLAEVIGKQRPPKKGSQLNGHDHDRGDKQAGHTADDEPTPAAYGPPPCPTRGESGYALPGGLH